TCSSVSEMRARLAMWRTVLSSTDMARLTVTGNRRGASNPNFCWQAKEVWRAPPGNGSSDQSAYHGLAVLVDLSALAVSVAPGSRLIGLDLGEKTIGIALSDTQRTIASPLVTRKRTNFAADFAFLTGLVSEHGVGGLIVGLPLNMN